MTDKPILYNAPMVRAILDGSKTQTRRVLKVQPDMNCLKLPVGSSGWSHYFALNVPLAVGDTLWVKETWRTLQKWDDDPPRLLMDDQDKVDYAADGFPRNPLWAWGKTRVSIFMPRWASRISLRVTGVKVERLQDISEADAKAEGWNGPLTELGYPVAKPVQWFSSLWESINGPGSWDANPWVVAYTFERIEP